MNARRGVALSLSASSLFALLFYWASLMDPMSAEAAFAWRFAFTAPVFALILLLRGRWGEVKAALRELAGHPGRIAAFVIGAAILAAQFWLFTWAPLNGRALQVSLGYFMMPLVMTVIGLLLYRERLNRIQVIAVAAALCGVTNQFFQAGGLSWEVLVVAVGYPVYFVLRRWIDIRSHLGGTFLEMALLVPVSVLILGLSPDTIPLLQSRPVLLLLVPGLVLLGTIGLAFFMLANRDLPFAIFGLLSYVEPVLLLVVALALGDTIQRGEWLTYVPIWSALGLLALDGWLALRRQRFAVGMQEAT